MIGLAAMVPFFVLLVGGLGIRLLGGARAIVLAWSCILAGFLAFFYLWGDRASVHEILLSDRLSQLLGVLILLGTALILSTTNTLSKRHTWSPELRSRTLSCVVLSSSGMVLSVSSRNLLVISIGFLLTWLTVDMLRDSVNVLRRPLTRINLLALALVTLALVLLRIDCGSLDLAQIETAMLARDAGFVGSTGLVLLLLGLVFQGMVPLVFLGVGDEGTDGFNMLMILSQVSLFGSLLRITGWLIDSANLWGVVLAFSSVLAMVVGSAVALRQNDLRRLLVTASMTQSGYLLLGVLTGGDAGRSSVLAFLPGFVVAGLAAYSAAISLEGHSGIHSTGRGLGWGRPVQGVTLGICALSLAGLPPTVGFMGRYRLFDLAVGEGHLAFVAVALVATVVGFYLYAKVPIALFMESTDSDPGLKVGPGWKMVWTAALLAVVALGILPEPWLALAGRAALEFF